MYIFQFSTAVVRMGSRFINRTYNNNTIYAKLHVYNNNNDCDPVNHRNLLVWFRPFESITGDTWKLRQLGYSKCENPVRAGNYLENFPQPIRLYGPTNIIMVTG